MYLALRISIIVNLCLVSFNVGKLAGWNIGFEVGKKNAEASLILKSCELRHNGVIVNE